MALATLAYMADHSSKLDRMFGVLRTIADFGPLAVSSSEFSATSKIVVERVLVSMDSTEGALCSLDEQNSPRGMEDTCYSELYCSYGYVW